MTTKYYSEVLNKYFDSEGDCITAENKYYAELEEEKKKKEEAKVVADDLIKMRKEVIDAYKKADVLYDNYINELKKYNKKYKVGYCKYYPTISYSNVLKMLEDTFSIF